MTTYGQYQASMTPPRKPAKNFKVGNLGPWHAHASNTMHQWNAMTPRPPSKKHRTPPIGHPIPPGQTPAGTPPHPPVPPGPTLSPFEAWYMNNPAYLAAHPNYENQKGQLEAQYGWVPQYDANHHQMVDAQGRPMWSESTGQGSENSMVNQLRRALAGKSQQIQDSANSRGLLFSGAQGQMQQNAIASNAQDQSDTLKAFENAMLGVNTNESNLISSLYGDYIKDAPPGSPPAVAKANATAADAAKTKAEADRQARIKKAQDHLRQDKIDAANRKKRPKRHKRHKTHERPGAGMTGGIAGGGV